MRGGYVPQVVFVSHIRRLHELGVFGAPVAEHKSELSSARRVLGLDPPEEEDEKQTEAAPGSWLGRIVRSRSWKSLFGLRE